MLKYFSKVCLFVSACFAICLGMAAGQRTESDSRSWRDWQNSVLSITASKGTSHHPFSFTFADETSQVLLNSWSREQHTRRLDRDRTRITTIWRDPKTGLRVEWEAVRFGDFPALDWVLYFENAGSNDTPILQDIYALDQVFSSPLQIDGPYRVHRMKGALADASDFEPSLELVSSRHSEKLSAGGGRSSNKDFPFFKVETGAASLIFAIGWSGQWSAELRSPDNRHLRVTAGLEHTHFLLHPGERIRTPRILELSWAGDTLECNARFRELIYKHYAAKRNGKTPLPIPFSNTCFTRGGGWLNECNEQNQISLIDAYAPLGLEGVLTDAGWFEGGWPAGAGNWNPRKDAYPNGMRPLAEAAKKHGMIYGLWFEPERVVKGTSLQREHPGWILAAGKEPQGTYLLNFGLPEVQDYFFNIVKGFMDLPGFRFYRQDFNMDPLPFWTYNDAPDRQGITESKYVAGLYAYWDKIAKTWPDSLREECASGGRRLDLETIQRMHVHQESDFWFDNETDQNRAWSLSQYLPNNVFDTPLTRLDDYSFHSCLPTSLVIGWIADAPGFDSQRAGQLLDQYRELREYLVGGWYPLLPYSRSPESWMGSQYHRRDLNAGLLLVFRRAQSPVQTMRMALHGLDSGKAYELSFDSTGKKLHHTGAELMSGFDLTLPSKPSSELILYRMVPK